MTTTVLRISALCLLVFLGLTGLWGGYELITDPTGESLKLPFELIEATPFKDYLIPGIALFCGIGILSLLITWLVVKRRKYYPSYILLQGVILILWLTSELALNVDFFFPQTHITYYVMGFLLVLIGWKLKKNLADEQHCRHRN